MSYFARSVLNDIAANPTYLAAVVTPAFIASLRTTMGSAFSVAANIPDALMRAIVADIVMFEMKPYGTSTPSNAYMLADCLASPLLECSNYCSSAEQLRALNWPGDNVLTDFAEWDYGEFGNHQYMFSSSGASAGLIRDPTIGLFVSGANVDLIVSHYHFPPASMYSFFSWDNAYRDTSPPIGADISSFNSKVIDSHQNGHGSVFNLLPYTRTFANMLTTGPLGGQRTPGTAVGGLQT